MAKFLNELSTLFALQFVDTPYDSAWFTQQMRTVFEPYPGALLTTVLTVTVLTALAILLDGGRAYLPAVRGRDTVCYWGALLIYIGGTGYYVYTAGQNMLLLV